MKIKVSRNNDHDGVSHGVKCSQEGDRIPPVESNGQSLEQEHRLSCVFRGCSDALFVDCSPEDISPETIHRRTIYRDASANFLDQLNGGLVPNVSSVNCHWKKTCSLLPC